ncbi:MAG TPA: hypothetical protein VGX97_10135 [bacterium]|nr:hypothetical protein [bacterium]
MMPARTKPLAAMVAGLAMAVAVGLAGPGSAELTVKGDDAAWREVTAAFGKLNTLPGYRMKMTLAAGQTMIIEVAQAGNAMHSTMQSQSGGMEMVRVGDQSRYRLSTPGAPAGWMCQGIPPMPRVNDPTAVQGTVEIARAPDSAIDGEAMHVYAYTIEASAMGQSTGNVKTTLYVGAGNGLPRRAVVAAQGGEYPIEYYDYGAPIQIALPPCSPTP